MKHPIPCPQCGHADSEILETRKARRRHQCYGCKYRYSSVEWRLVPPRVSKPKPARAAAAPIHQRDTHPLRGVLHEWLTR